MGGRIGENRWSDISGMSGRIQRESVVAYDEITQLVPLRPLGVKITEVGHIEIDTVAHCGDSMSGLFAWTVTQKRSGSC